MRATALAAITDYHVFPIDKTLFPYNSESSQRNVDSLSFMQVRYTDESNRLTIAQNWVCDRSKMAIWFHCVQFESDRPAPPIPQKMP